MPQLSCVPLSKVSVPHFARLAVFVDRFLWDYNGKPLFKDRHHEKWINNNYNFGINDCRACNLSQRKFGRVLETLGLDVGGKFNIHIWACSGCLIVRKGEQHGGDDTAANYIKVRCRDFNSTAPEYELVKGNGHGDYGSFGLWNESCPAHSAVCGIQTRIEGDQHGGDDTALNDVKLFCCTD